MRTGTLMIDGEEFVVLPKAEYLRLSKKAGGDAGGGATTIDALDFTRAALGRDLKAARVHAGLTQAELAKKLKKAQTTVSGSESGKIQVSEDYVRKVLKACGLPEDWKAE